MTTQAGEHKLRRLQQDLRGLHEMHPSAELTGAAQNMTAQLHIAVHGDTWARPEPPEQVWVDLLRRVQALREALWSQHAAKDIP